MQYGATVQELRHARLDRRRPVVWEYDCRHDHVAAVVEGEGYSGPTWPIMSGERVGATATFHPADRDRPAGAEGESLAADKIKVAHPIKVVIICDPGCAIAGAELGAEIELHLRTAVLGPALECSAFSPLIQQERPGHLVPDRIARRCGAATGEQPDRAERSAQHAGDRNDQDGAPSHRISSGLAANSSLQACRRRRVSHRFSFTHSGACMCVLHQSAIAASTSALVMPRGLGSTSASASAGGDGGGNVFVANS